MKVKPRHLILISILVCLCGTVFAQVYQVNKIPNGKLSVTGRGESEEWSSANELAAFYAPWNIGNVPSTKFYALWDDTWLYCKFVVKDDMIFIFDKNKRKTDVAGSDRVEMFLNMNDSMRTYYCLELDANGRTLDYSASYYRKVYYDWNWPTGQLTVKSSRTKDGYIVEYAISLVSLKELGLLQKKKLRAGLFRAEYTHPPKNMNDVEWISWIKPSSATPDFHIPSAFGTLILNDQKENHANN